MMKKVLLLTMLALLTTVMYAQDYQMQSTSMYNTQASNAPTNVNISAPGAAAPAVMYTTTYDETSSVSRSIRKLQGEGVEPGEAADGSPIGGALLPLVLMAAGYAVAKRRQK